MMMKIKNKITEIKKYKNKKATEVVADFWKMHTARNLLSSCVRTHKPFSIQIDAAKKKRKKIK